MNLNLESIQNEFFKNALSTGDDLQRQYSPSQWCTRSTPEVVVQQYVDNMVTATTSARDAINCETGVEYSENGQNCKLDIYYPQEYTKGTPIFIFIHGGYWQEGSRDLAGHAAKAVIEMNAIYIGIGYDLCPSVPLRSIVTEIQEAFQFIRHRFPYTTAIHIMGHSAGAHLATMVLAQPAHDFPSLLPLTIYPISGIFDLRPLLETDINDALKLTADEAEALSPMHGDNFKKIHANARRITRFVIIIAENDSPAFHDQSSKFFEMLKATGVNTEYIEIKDTDHFDIVEKSVDPAYLMNKVIQDHLTTI